MRNSFRAYYVPTESEFEEIWKSCLFVPDANVLLTLYRYSAPTRDELLRLFGQLSDRIWLPHQVALEYQKNRHGVIVGELKKANDLLKAIKGARDNITQTIDLLRRHPFIDAKKFSAQMEKFFNQLEGDIQRQIDDHPDRIIHDDIQDNLGKLFNDKVGQPFDIAKLTEIYTEGEKRYKDKIPPGYEDDKKKEGNEKFGDLIIWKQLIDKVIEEKQSIIFISDDRKEDWWLKTNNGRTVSPRPELRQEIQEASGVDFYMYSSAQFMKHAKKILSKAVKQASIEEVQRAREEGSAAYTIDIVGDHIVIEFNKILQEKLGQFWAGAPEEITDRYLRNIGSDSLNSFKTNIICKDELLEPITFDKKYIFRLSNANKHKPSDKHLREFEKSMARQKGLLEGMELAEKIRKLIKQ